MTEKNVLDMPFSGTRNLSKDLTISLVVLISLVAVIVMGINYLIVSRQATEQYQLKTDEYLIYLQDSLASPIWNMDKESIDIIAQSFMKNEIIAGLHITGTSKETLFKSPSAGITQGDFIRKSAPIFYLDKGGQELVGHVELIISFQSINKQKQQFLLSSLVLLCFIVLAVFGFTGLLIDVFLRKPMTHLQQAIERIAQGEYNYRASFPPQNEIKTIFSAFNQMGQEIQHRDAALTESNNRLAAILDNSTAIIYLKGTDGRYIMINQRYARLFDIDQRNVKGLTDFDLFPDATAQQFQANDRRVQESGTAMEFEEEVTQNKHLHTYLSIKFPLKDANENTYAICGISTDITARKKSDKAIRQLNEELEQRVNERTAELQNANNQLLEEISERQRADNALYASETLLRATLESTVDGIIVITRQGRITHANQRFWQMWRIKNIPAAQKDLQWVRKKLESQLIATYSDRDYQKKIEWLYATTEVGLDILRCKDGRVFERYSSPLIIGDQNKGRVWCFRDISTIKQNEEALARAKESAERANRAKSDFLATMSHEIRTPMNGIIGMTDILADSSLDELQTDYVQTIQKSAEALLYLINDILDFSKIEAGKIELEHLAFDLAETLDKVTDELAAKANEKSLAFGCIIDPQVPRSLVGDPGRLRQVLINLISNAIKFTSAGQVRVHISVEKAAAAEVTLKCSVKDTGIGIPANRIHRLFKSFSQVDASTTREFGGTGLGLAISKSLTEKMGGSIGVESKEGKGAEFWFTFQMEKAPPLKTDTDHRTKLLQGKNVLAASASPLRLEVIQACLRQTECEFETTSAPDQVLEVLKRADQNRRPFDAIIIDDTPPDMDGASIAAAIRKALPEQSAKWMRLIDHGEISPSDKPGMPTGFDLTMLKPIKYRAFAQNLADLFSGRKPRLDLDDPGKKRQLFTEVTDQHRPTHKILVAEDNETNQKVARHILRKAGCDAHIVSNGQEAIDSFAETAYHLIFMDVQMPVLDGLSATKKIRQIESERGCRQPIPIIALTANALKENRDACLSAGMVDYIAKPVNPEKMIQALEKWAGVRAEGLFGKGNRLAHPEDSNAMAQNDTPVDLKEGLARAMGNMELLSSLLAKFETHAKDQREQIAQAVAENDCHLVRELAHSMKGAAGNLSIKDLSLAAADLEQIGKSGNLHQADRLLEKLDLELQRFQSYMASENNPHES